MKIIKKIASIAILFSTNALWARVMPNRSPQPANQNAPQPPAPVTPPAQQQQLPQPVQQPQQQVPNASTTSFKYYLELVKKRKPADVITQGGVFVDSFETLVRNSGLRPEFMEELLEAGKNIHLPLAPDNNLTIQALVAAEENVNAFMSAYRQPAPGYPELEPLKKVVAESEKVLSKLQIQLLVTKAKYMLQVELARLENTTLMTVVRSLLDKHPELLTKAYLQTYGLVSHAIDERIYQNQMPQKISTFIKESIYNAWPSLKQQQPQNQPATPPIQQPTRVPQADRKPVSQAEGIIFKEDIRRLVEIAADALAAELPRSENKTLISVVRTFIDGNPKVLGQPIPEESTWAMTFDAINEKMYQNNMPRETIDFIKKSIHDAWPSLTQQQLEKNERIPQPIQQATFPQQQAVDVDALKLINGNFSNMTGKDRIFEKIDDGGYKLTTDINRINHTLNYSISMLKQAHPTATNKMIYDALYATFRSKAVTINIDTIEPILQELAKILLSPMPA
jgi:hypothetical protein